MRMGVHEVLEYTRCKDRKGKKKEIIDKTEDVTNIDKIGDAINIEEDAISNTCASPNKKARYNNTQQNVISLPHLAQLQIGYCTYLSTVLEKKLAEINIQWEQFKMSQWYCTHLSTMLEKKHAEINIQWEEKCAQLNEKWEELNLLRDELSQEQAEFGMKLDLIDLDIENRSFGSFENMCINA